MEEILKQILDGQNQMKQDISGMKQDISGMKQSITNIENKVNEIEKTVNGSQEDIQAILEITATKTDVSKIISRIEVLSIHSVNQEAEIRELKLAK